MILSSQFPSWFSLPFMLDDLPEHTDQLTLDKELDGNLHDNVSLIFV